MNHLDWINQPLIAIGSVKLTSKGLLLSSLVLLVGMWLARRLRRYLQQYLGPVMGLDKSTVFTLSTLVFYAITALTLVIAFSLLGFDFTNLAIIAGALSVGVGFGLQDIAKNFISGLLLLFDRSIRVGDYIELSNGGLRGTVEQIRVRSQKALIGKCAMTTMATLLIEIARRCHHQEVADPQLRIVDAAS